MNRNWKRIVMALGGLLVLVGGIWILQGINILPGSFMTGNPQWAINGAITLAAGLLLLWAGARQAR